MLNNNKKIETDFRQTMRALCTTVSVVSVYHHKIKLGMTINSAVSVSMDPPTLLFSINNKSSLIPLLEKSKKACINVLNSQQADIAKIFSSLPSGDFRFNMKNWFINDEYILLKKAKAHIPCHIKDIITYQSHRIFICEVISSSHEENYSPLIYMDGAYVNTMLAEAV